MKRFLNFVIFSFLCLSLTAQNYTLKQTVRKWNRSYVPDTVVLRKTFEDCRNASGTITGSGTSGQVTFWNAANTITGTPGFTFSSGVLSNEGSLFLTDTTGDGFLHLSKQVVRPSIGVTPPNWLRMFTDSNTNLSILHTNGYTSTFSITNTTDQNYIFLDTSGNITPDYSTALFLPKKKGKGFVNSQVSDDGVFVTIGNGTLKTDEILNVNGNVAFTDELTIYNDDSRIMLRDAIGNSTLQMSGGTGIPTLQSYGAQLNINSAGNLVTIGANLSMTAGDIRFATKVIDGTPGDAVTIDSPTGQFIKDTDGTNFTVTNNFVTTTSIILITVANDPGNAGYNIVVKSTGSGNFVVGFSSAGIPTAPQFNTKINFLIIN